jgi:hypothetical protein
MGLLSYLAENFDLPILDWIAENIRCNFLDKVMPWITKLGDGGIFWISPTSDGLRASRTPTPKRG